MTFLINPFVLGGDSIPGTADIVAIQFDTGTATGDVDYTTNSLAGLTPKAVLCFPSYHNAANTTVETATMSLSVGAGDATNNVGGGTYSEDGLATVNTARISTSARTVYLRGLSSTEKQATASFIANGVRLNYNANSATDRRGIMAAFAGSDVTAQSGTIAMGTGTSAITTTPGFQSDVLFFFQTDEQFDNTLDSGTGNFIFGVCARDGSNTQRSISWVEDDGQAAGNPFLTLSTAFAAVRKNSTTGAKVWGGTVGNFTSTSFDITPDASTTSAELGYLALDLGARSFKLVDYNTPTSTGNSTITGVGFKPSFAMMVLTNLEAVDDYPATTSDNQGGFSINLIGTETHGVACRVDAGAGTTDTATRVMSAIIGASATSCNALEGQLVGFNSDGMTINWSAVQGTAKKGFILFIS